MEARVKKLEIDRNRAQKQLKKTLEAHEAAEAANKRKQDHLNFKKEWLKSQNKNLDDLRTKNNIDRETRKRNIYNQRQRVYLENIFARD